MLRNRAPRTLIIDAVHLSAIVAETGLDALMDQIIRELTATLRTYSIDRFNIPPREGFQYRAPSLGLIEWMPALKVGEQATIKIVGYHPRNPAVVGLPTVLSALLVFDTRTGHLSGMIDGTLSTALRTGAASAIASRILGRPDARILGVIGCGAQAVTQVHALSRVFDFEQILVFDVDEAAMRSFPGRTMAFGLDESRIGFGAADEIARQADILCTATAVGVGEGPIIRDVPHRAHLHINAVGSDFPGKLELPRSLLERALVCPDFRAQAVREGECQQLRPEQIGPDLAALVRDSDRYVPARDRLTVFDSTGWALEDHVAAQILFQHARRLGLGEEIEVELTGSDPLNPYDLPMLGVAQSRLAAAE